MWDRLISLDDIKVDHQASVDLDQLKVMVASDLERLLNSRRCLPDEDLFGYPSARDSVANFGIPDFSTSV
jgi:predicted component of type VI protein secretion system